MSRNSAIWGLLAGLAAGAALGVLLAPRPGKETRDLLKKKGEQAKDNLNELLDDGFDQWKRVKGKVVERAQMTKEDIQEFLEFMAAEGRDLKERIKRDVERGARSAAHHASNPAANN